MRFEKTMILVFFVSVAVASASAVETEHFDPKGKPPSKHTIEVLE